MQMAKMLLPLATALSITAVAYGVPVRCNKTPFLGGQQHNSLLINNAAVGGAGVVAVQGNPSTSATAPVDADAGWYTIATLNAAAPLEQEIILEPWMRVNITTLGTGTITVALEGVQ